MLARMTIIIAILGLSATSALATTIHVPGDYPTIQGGINAASAGDTVLVASGVQADSSIAGIPVQGDMADFQLPGNLMVTEIHQVVSQTSGPVDPSEYNWASEPGWCFVSFWSFNYDGHLLDITFRTLSVYPERPGIPVSIVLRGESPTDTRVFGGAGQPVLSIGADGVVVESLMIMEANGWDDVSGILATSRDDLTIRNNVIYNMNGWGDVSAIRLVSCTNAIIHNNTFFELGSWQIGVAIRLDDCAGTSVSSNVASEIMWGGGYGILCNGTSAPTISYNCFHGCGYGGCSAGTGDIGSDPLFVSPYALDFHLQSQYGSYHGGQWLPDPGDSPGIDAGNPAFAYEREPEPNGDRINMGAYGNTPEASRSAGGTAAPECAPHAGFVLHQNAPNPFNPWTRIEYRVPRGGSPVTLQVFDVHGRRVQTLVDAFQLEGSHGVVWDGRNRIGREMPSGIYFYRLQAGSFSQTRRMLFVR